MLKRLALVIGVVGCGSEETEEGASIPDEIQVYEFRCSYQCVTDASVPVGDKIEYHVCSPSPIDAVAAQEVMFDVREYCNDTAADESYGSLSSTGSCRNVGSTSVDPATDPCANIVLVTDTTTYPCNHDGVCTCGEDNSSCEDCRTSCGDENLCEMKDPCYCKECASNTLCSAC